MTYIWLALALFVVIFLICITKALGFWGFGVRDDGDFGFGNKQNWAPRASQSRGLGDTGRHNPPT